MLGILSLNPQGIAGSGMEMIGAAASLSALSGLFVLLKRNKINLMEDDLKGVFAGSPILGVSFLIILFSLAGLPGLAHFPGLFMVWMGLFKGSWILTLVSLLGVVIITVPLVRFVGLALYRGEQADSGFKRLTSTQLLMISIFVVIILGIGIFPDIFMKNIKQSTEAAWKVFSHQI
jgi:NADH-quinone oxidoreductase subunit M